MKQKLFTLLAFMVISVAASGQARPGSRFYQCTMVRICESIDEVAHGCKDFDDETIWEVDNDLEHIRMITDATSTMAVHEVSHDEGSPKFIFVCRDVSNNMIYDILFDFESKTVFVLDRSDERRYLFYWSKSWEKPY